MARSNEAKQMGIKAGTPYFQLKELFPGKKIHVFSSNYELYGEITERVMSLVRKASPQFFRYSIDEGFCDLHGMEHLDLKQWGEDLATLICRATAMPVSIGIAPTKTLAKMGSHFAKKYPGYRHCCFIKTDEQREKALALYPVDEVWGIGRRYTTRLQAVGVHTAADFAHLSRTWVRQTFNIVAERTWRELNGEDCVPLEDMSKTQTICTSRSFPGMVSDLQTLRTSVSNFAARCAEKLRRQHSVAQIVSVFLDTNHFRNDLPQYWNMAEVRFPTATNNTQQIVEAAYRCTEQIFRQGYQYKKAGCIVMGICNENEVQTSFLDYNPQQREKLSRLDEALDHINRLFGSETIVLGSQQYTAPNGKGKANVFKDSIKHDFRSPCYTTRWCDIPEAM